MEKIKKILNSIAEFYKYIPNEDLEGYEHVKQRIVCKDNFSFSVQQNKYSTKYRFADIDKNTYDVAFISKREKILEPFNSTSIIFFNLNIQENEFFSERYTNVPSDIIDSIINIHGGVVGFQSAQGFIFINQLI